MRVLFDQVVYDMRNKGNIALLQMALRRVHNLWPDASLEVMAETAHILRLYCPGAFPVNILSTINWSENRPKLQRIRQMTPNPVLRTMLEIREELKYRKINPKYSKSLLPQNEISQIEVTKHVMEISMPDPSDSPDVEQALRGADIVIGTGGGYLVDTDKDITIPVLKRLKRAKSMGKFVALVGQGLGQIEDPELQSLASAVLPELDLILVRECDFAIPTLQSLGVSRERILMSGDDAVELAYGSRNATLGRDIGISIRLAGYTDVSGHDIQQIRPVLHKTAAQYNARLVGLPTSCCGQESDQFQISELLAGYPRIFQSSFRFESITDLISKVGHCRVVVAGAFHAAVFALAQGIPAIGIVKSEEYSIKFRGLVDQFGPGCQLLYLNDKHFPEQLADAIITAWESADRLRPQLLERAKTQIQLNQAAYQTLHDLYASHHF